MWQRPSKSPALWPTASAVARRLIERRRAGAGGEGAEVPARFERRLLQERTMAGQGRGAWAINPRQRAGSAANRKDRGPLRDATSSIRPEDALAVQGRPKPAPEDAPADAGCATVSRSLACRNDLAPDSFPSYLHHSGGGGPPSIRSPPAAYTPGEQNIRQWLAQ